jgi:hypothetical protein
MTCSFAFSKHRLRTLDRDGWRVEAYWEPVS